MEQEKMEIATPEEIEKRMIQFSGNALDLASKLIVKDFEGYEAAAALSKELKARRVRIEEACNPNIARWNAGHKSATAEKKAYLAPIQSAEGVIDAKAGKWKREDDERIRLENIRLQEKEKKRLEAHEEKVALALSKSGDQEGAEAVLEQAVAPTTPTPAPQVKGQRIPGYSHAKYYSSKLKDPEKDSLKKLIVAVAKGKAPVTLLKLDETNANKIASAMKEALDYPGLELVITYGSRKSAAR